MRAKILVIGARGIPDCEGGAEKNAERLFPLIAGSDYRVLLMGLQENIKHDVWNGVELKGAPQSKILKTDKLLYYFMAVFEALKFRPDIVHFQGLGSAIVLLLYKMLGFKTVVRYGSADYLVGKWGLIGRAGFRLAEWQLRFSDAVIAVTPALALRLRKKGIKRGVFIIPNALDDPQMPNETEPLPADPYILAVGRVTEQKNIHRLIGGYNLYKDRNGAGIKMMVVGGIDDEAYIPKVNELLDDDTLMRGRLKRSTLPALYAGAYCYVNSSLHEGSSNAVLEAISWGAPVILSAIPENKDFGLPDHHYFDPESEEDIARILQEVAVDRERFKVDKTRFLTWNDVAQRTLSIYQNSLGV